MLDAFGYWPSFHDAYVHELTYSNSGDAFVQLTLHGFEMTSIVEERGYFKLIKHHLVRFAFQGISDAKLDSFMDSNILSELGLSSVEEFQRSGRFRVDLDSAMGGDVGGSFFARCGQILDVVPCNRDGKLAEQIAPHQPPPLGSSSGATVRRTLDSLPEPAPSDGR